MADLINLDAERGKRDRPDGELVDVDDDGFTIYLYTAHYAVDDEIYAYDFWAYDFDHAEAQVAAIRAGLVLDGQVMSRVRDERLSEPATKPETPMLGIFLLTPSGKRQELTVDCSGSPARVRQLCDIAFATVARLVAEEFRS